MQQFDTTPTYSVKAIIMFTLSWIGFLFILKNTVFGAISLTEKSCAALISKVEGHLSDRFFAKPWCIVNICSVLPGSK